LEMGESQIVERMITNVQEVSLYDLKSGRVRVNEETKKNIENRLLWINDNTGVTVADISKIISGCNADFSVVFVDYLQLVRGTGAWGARYEIIDNICQELRNIAKERNIAVVLLAQLNREAERRENHRPRLSDLRESGGIEQTADKILFLYRPSYYLMYEQQERDNAGDTSEAYIIVAKNRNGKLEDIPVVWKAEQMTFKPCTFELGEF